VDGSTVSYTVVASDAAQNTSSTYSSTFTVDTKAPSITITSTLSRLAPGQQTTLTFTSSEPITNFDLNDITVSTGSVSDFTIVNSQDFTVKYTYPSITANDVTFSLLPGKVDDLVGNSNTLTSTLTLVLNSGPVGSPVPIIITQDDPDMVINLTNGMSDPDGDSLQVNNLQVVYTMSTGGSQYTTVNNQVLANKFSKIVSTQSLNGNELAINTSKSKFLMGIQTGKIEISYDISDGTYALRVNNEIVIMGKNDAPVGSDLIETRTFQLDSSGQKLKDIQGNDLTAEIKEDFPVNSFVSATDNDEGDQIKYILGSTDSLKNGKLDFDSTNGNYKYVPVLHFYGDVFFDYYVEDLFGIRKGPYKVVIKIAERPDDDGIPTVLETITKNTDLDGDGVPDRKQANISNFPMTSAAEFSAGKNWALGNGGVKPDSSNVGSILIGDLGLNGTDTSRGKYRLDLNAKLKDIGILPKPDSISSNFAFNSDLFQFSIVPEANKSLTDLDNDLSNGLQTRVVINLPKPIAATTYLKKLANGKIIVFKDDQSLDTWDDGATLIDANGDGLVERIVITITDNGIGDSDPTLGKITDPGGLGIVKPIIDDVIIDSLAESQRNGKIIFDFNDKFSNSDLDLENDSLTYSFSSSTNPAIIKAIGINEKTGQVFVKDSTYFDFELFVNNNDISRIKFDVIVADKYSFTDTASVDFGILNIDEIPLIISKQEINFIEKQPSSTVVIAIETIPDYKDITKFSIVNGKDGNYFSLDSINGNLRFKIPPRFRKKKQYKLDIQAIDINGKSDQIQLNINIIGIEVLPNTNMPDIFKTYGDGKFKLKTNTNSNGSITYEISDSSVAIIKGDSLTIIGSGIAKIKVSQEEDSLNNYLPFEFYTDLIVNKAKLKITARNNERCFASKDPKFDYFITGLVNGEDTSVFSNKVELISDADINSAPGNYSIIPGGVTARNYSIEYVNGVYLIRNLPSSAEIRSKSNYVCEGDSIILRVDTGYRYTWFRNDTIVFLATNDSLAVFDSGNYKVKLENQYGCELTSKVDYNIKKYFAPVPEFDFQFYCVDKPVYFTNKTNHSRSGPVKYIWNNGSGGLSNLENPIFTYATTGTKSIVLSVIPEFCPVLKKEIIKPISIEEPIPAKKLNGVDALTFNSTQLNARLFDRFQYEWSPTVNWSNSYRIPNPLVIISNETLFKIKMTAPSSCVTVDTMLVRAFTKRIYLPNTFTPNGDGVNDIFQINPVEIKELKYFRIINQWGARVFETRNLREGWDGKLNGANQPIATYTWILEAVDTDGNPVRETGSVTLLR